MTLDTNDLRAVFTQQVAALTQVPDFASSAAAKGRVAQRRRAVGAAAAVGLMVAGILGITQLTGSSHRTAVPATPKGLATYAGGLKLVAGQVGGTPLDFDVKIPATADGLPAGLGVSLACAASSLEGAKALDPQINLSINGKDQGSVTGCQKTFPTAPSVTISWDAKNQPFAPGSTIHVHVDLSGTKLPNERLRAGVYAAVPLDEYVYPPRPTTLTPVDKAQEGHGVGEGPLLGTWSVSSSKTLVLRPRHGLIFATQTTEPGRLQVFVNGKQQVDVRSWVYTQSATAGLTEGLSLTDLGVSPGDPVTVTVVATGYTGDTWRVFADDTTG